MQYISVPFGYVMRFCYNLLNNYGLSIILFTLITKIIIFPVTLWTHKNSVKLVKIQPQLNELKIKYFGEKDTISEKQLELYKKEHYHPLLGIVPMLIQIFLLICVIQIIYNPLTYVLSLNISDINNLVIDVCRAFSLDADSNSIQLSVVKAVQDGFTVEGYDLSPIKGLDMSFLGFDLSATPISAGGKMLLVPLIAGGSSLALSLFQNKMNPIQAEQGRAGTLITNVISVGISLILGGFVPAGIGLYWICSNLFTMLQQLILNLIINPKKHIDYERLEKTKAELARLDEIGSQNSRENSKRSKADYKRFFSVANKHLVFYSERNGFFKYYEKLIDYILSHSNIIIHYITSDPNDDIFKLAEKESKVKAYYIDEKRLITLFMKMDADIVVMTMPDIENFHYKRSYVKKDIEYIYIFHGPTSTHMNMNKGCIDNYDTIFCVGDFHVDEIRRQEELYGLKEKNLVVCGYGFLETLKEKYDAMDKTENERRKVLIAPSWQKDNILDSCIDNLLEALLGKGFNVVVRPHPEYVKRYPQRLDDILKRYEGYSRGDLSFELDFSSSESIYNSDVLITDWSAAAYEFSYVTLKPSIFIDTPMKVNNPDYEKIGIEPLEIKLRSEIGKRYNTNDFSCVADDIKYMTEHKEEYSEKIEKIRDTYVSNFGHSGEVGGKYIIRQLIEKQKKSKENK